MPAIVRMDDLGLAHMWAGRRARPLVRRHPRPSGVQAKPTDSVPLELFSIGVMPGLTEQSSTHGWWLLDRPVEPGNDGEVWVI
jgi:hypothetical protein